MGEASLRKPETTPPKRARFCPPKEADWPPRATLSGHGWPRLAGCCVLLCHLETGELENRRREPRDKLQPWILELQPAVLLDLPNPDPEQTG